MTASVRVPSIGSKVVERVKQDHARRRREEASASEGTDLGLPWARGAGEAVELARAAGAA